MQTMSVHQKVAAAFPPSLRVQNRPRTQRLRKSPSSTDSPSSSKRSISYLPCLPAQKDDAGMFISYNKSGRFTSAAVSFKPAGLIHTQLEGDSTIVVRLTQLDPEAPVHGKDAVRPLWNALWTYFARGGATAESVDIELPLPSPALHDALINLGAVELHPTYRLSRSALFQLYHYATTSIVSPPFPRIPAPFGLDHPLRAPKPAPGVTIYSRRIPHLEEFFKLSVCAPHNIETVHYWLNKERVAAHWDSKGTWEDHERFLEMRREDPHTLPVIGAFINAKGYGNEAFPPEEEAVYAELYWAKEDALGQFLGEERVQDYDRGLHALVGSDSHRGPHRVRAWLPSMVHYCFLDDARTNRVIAEPNVNNVRMIEYFESVGFEKREVLEFPHKKAQFMVCERRRFYELCPF